jgi:hypothetical protein
MGTGSFPGVKRPGCGADHPPPPSAEACYRVTFTLLTCNVTAYRNTVSWQCGQDSWPRNVSKVGYAVTLRARWGRCRYLAVASKGWYGYGLSRSGRATWNVTTVRSSRLLYIHDASGSRIKLGTPWYKARRILLRREARGESSDRNSYRVSHLQSYGVTVRGNVTSVYPPL